MTDERLCKCGHVLSTHDRDTPSGPMCGMCKCALFEANPSTGERQAEHDPDMNEWMNAPLGAAPSTDEGEARLQNELWETYNEAQAFYLDSTSRTRRIWICGKRCSVRR